MASTLFDGNRESCGIASKKNITSADKKAELDFDKVYVGLGSLFSGLVSTPWDVQDTPTETGDHIRWFLEVGLSCTAPASSETRPEEHTKKDV
jgi:hypothetical protein